MQLFKSEFGNVREITKAGEPWFIAKDVCQTLGLTVKNSVRYLDEDEKAKASIKHLSSNEYRNVTVINESGLYSLILRSRKPEAKAFKKWVTSELLPAIRKTGKYEIPKKEVKEAKETRNGLTKQWEDHGITGHNFMNLTKHIKKTSGLTKPREQLTREERAKMTAIEAVEMYKLMKSKDNGYYPLKQSATNTIGLIEQA